MNEHAALAYQTAIVLREAVEQAKSSDRDKINDAVRALKIDPGPLMIMPYKKIEFDDTGQNPHATRAHPAGQGRAAGDGLAGAVCVDQGDAAVPMKLDIDLDWLIEGPGP